MLEYVKTQSRRIWNAFFFSLDGFKATFGAEHAVQQWAALAVIGVPLGIWLGSDGVERAVLAGSVILIVIVEMINTAIETTIDRISQDRHPLSKKAKDIGSAMVLMTFLLAALVWALILRG